jgi:hypothetical protein
MESLLERAFAEAAKFPQEAQEAFARWILEELASEQRWDDAFSASADALAQLADEALAEHHAGRSEPFEPDDL